MDPPPLTVSKKRDPLRDGLLFQHQAGIGPLALLHPGSAALQHQQPASVGLFPNSALLRSGAEAAAINRSAEAQHIKRNWDALVSASPLPQAFRQALSPALAHPQLTSGWRSPAASAAPFLRDLYPLQLPAQRGPAVGGRLGTAYGLSGAAAEPLPAPSALYRSVVQQQRQQQQQQQQQVDSSKFTRVVHTQSPNYQAVLSSTLQVVRQAPAAPDSVPAPAHRGGGVILEELPPGSAPQPPPQQQRQQVIVVDGPLLLPPGALLPAQGLRPAALAAEAAAVVEPPGQAEEAQEPARTPAHTPSLLRSQGPAGQEPASMQRALAQVGSMVRDLCSPTPAKANDALQQEGQVGVLASQQARGAPSAAPAPAASQQRGSISAAQLPADGTVRGVATRAHGAVGAEQPAVSSGGTHKQCWWEPRAGRESQGGAPASQRRRRLRGQRHLPEGQQQQEDEVQLEFLQQLEEKAATAAPPAEDAGMEGHPTAKAEPIPQHQPAAQQEPVEECQPAETLGGAEVDAEDGAPAPASASSSQPQSSSTRKSAGGRSEKRRVKQEAGDGTAKRRTLLTRGNAATVQPILRAMGDNSDGIQVTRSGRPRMKPLPYWTNSRLVRDAAKDVVGIERKADLLGLSDQPPAPGRQQQQQQKPAPKGTAAPRVDSAKGRPGVAARPQQPEKPALSKAAGQGRQSRNAPAEQQPVSTADADGKGQARGQARAAKVEQSTQPSGRPRRRAAAGKAEPRQGGAKEMEAALQLQQLGQGGAPVSPHATGGVQGLAARAASAGARAAEEAAQRHRTPAPAQGQKPAQQPAAGRASRRAASSAAAGQTGPALPVVEGVPSEVLQRLAELPPVQRRRRCGHCKHCMNSASRQACLALRALRQQEGQVQPSGGGDGGTPAQQAQQQAQRKPEGPKPEPAEAELPEQRRGGPGKRQPKRGTVAGELQPSKRGNEPEPAAGRAAGKKRSAAAADRGAPPSKRARPQQQQQQQQQQQEVKDPKEEEGELALSGKEEEEEAWAGAGRAESPTGEDEEAAADEQGWTASQVAALQRAWLQIDPTATNFWQLVAKQVPGKTAAECYNRHMARHPTPPHAGRKPAPKKYLAAAKEGARLPEIKPGASKQVLQNAARKYTRQLQWQQKASKAQAAVGESGSGGGTAGLGEELLEEMEAAERKDRYIDQILRRRQGRPLGAGPRGRKAPAPLAPALRQAQQGEGRGAAGLPVQAAAAGVGRKLAAGDSEREVRAALAGLQQHQPDSEEDRDSQEGSDYYWSDC